MPWLGGSGGSGLPRSSASALSDSGNMTRTAWNRLLHERLQILKTVRAREENTVGEALASRTEFGGGFLFLAITDAFENDPSSGAALFASAR